MTRTDLPHLSVKELLQLQASITDELKRRKIVRTQNNPLGDYTEWLVAQTLGLELAHNSKAGFDGVSKDGIRVQIKGRRLTSSNKARQLSAIRNYAENDFDQLAAVIFDEHFDIMDAVLIPHAVVGEYASYRKHVNAHILSLQGSILSDPRVISIKQELAANHTNVGENTSR